MGHDSVQRWKACVDSFLNDPECVGNWEKACRKGGKFTRNLPDISRAEIQELIVQASEARQIKEEAEVEKLLQQMGTTDWKELADQCVPLFGRIAAGRVKASGSQIAALKEIFVRGHGKPVGKADEVEVGVVVLPVLNAGEKSEVCPECLKRAEANLDS